MVEKLTFEGLRELAERAGLRLADNELQRLLPGVLRARQQVVELRELIDRADEPVGAFKAETKRRP